MNIRIEIKDRTINNKPFIQGEVFYDGEMMACPVHETDIDGIIDMCCQYVKDHPYN